MKDIGKEFTHIRKNDLPSMVDVSDKSIGFNSEFNKVSIFYKDKKEETLEKASKLSIAEEIVKRVVNKLN